METGTLVALGILGFIVYLVFFSNIGKDYSKKTDLELIQLLGLHKNNVAAASKLGYEQHQRALKRMEALTAEMKKRGLIKQDTIPTDPALQTLLEKLAQKQFSKSVNEIKVLAGNNDPEALYQLAMVFHAAQETSTSLHYLTKSAESGNVEAQYALGWACIKNNAEKGSRTSSIDALKWFFIALEQGHPEAKKAIEAARKDVPDATFAAALKEARQWSATHIKRV